MKEIWACLLCVFTEIRAFYKKRKNCLDVTDKNTGEKYGVLSDVVNRGSQDLYVVKREDKPEAYIPAVAEFIAEIDLEKGIFVTPIEGMFE